MLTLILVLIQASAWGGPGGSRERPDDHERDRDRDRDRDRSHAAKLLDFNVFCRFPKCFAASRFEKHVDHEGDEVYDNSEHPRNPAFEIECHGQSIFNGLGRRFTDKAGTRIQAQAGPYPAIVLPPRALRDGHRRVKSLLELREATLEGDCYLYVGSPSPF
jgi:hypothetical protein